MKFEVLNKASVKDNVVYLPEGQLERSLYVEVNEILENLGGKWNRRKGGHIFEYDPTEALNVVVRDEIVPPNNPTAFHPTSIEIIDGGLDDMSYLDHDYVRLLEPSAGTGNASIRMKELYPSAHLDVVESLPLNASILREHHENVYEMDFMKYTNEPYDFIFMNPPFSVEGHRDLYIDHIYHAHSLLKDNRQMVVIVPSGFLYNSTKKIKEFRKWCFDRLIWLEKLSSGSFSTTNVSTIMMKLDKKDWATKPLNGWVSRNAWIGSLVIDNKETLYNSVMKKTNFDDSFWDDVYREGMKVGEYFVLDEADKKQLIRHYEDYE